MVTTSSKPRVRSSEALGPLHNNRACKHTPEASPGNNLHNCLSSVPSLALNEEDKAEDVISFKMYSVHYSETAIKK